MTGLEVASAVTDVGVLLHSGHAAHDLRSPEEIFNSVFEVFLLLGTIVGVVVIAYTLHKAIKYRDRGQPDPKGEDASPELGELPSGGGGGKKLFVSFGISAIIVLSLIIWTYGFLLQVESGTINQVEKTEALEDPLVIEVIGQRFSWQFVYPNNHSQFGTLNVPADRAVRLRVTSADVMHNFGIRGLGMKTDAMPGMYTDMWFVADEPGTHTAVCYELCGQGHSGMTAEVLVQSPSEYEAWYANTTGNASDSQ